MSVEFLCDKNSKNSVRVYQVYGYSYIIVWYVISRSTYFSPLYIYMYMYTSTVCCEYRISRYSDICYQNPHYSLLFIQQIINSKFEYLSHNSNIYILTLSICTAHRHILLYVQVDKVSLPHFTLHIYIHISSYYISCI